MSDNPYAPPESATGMLQIKGDPRSYWINKGLLYVRDGAILPDVCLESGRVDGEMTRIQQLLRLRYERVYLYLALGLVLGVWVLKLLFAPWVMLLAFFTHLIFRQSIEANVCSSRVARTRQKYLQLAKVVIGGGIIVFIGFAPFDANDLLVFGIGIGLLSQYLTSRVDQSFRVVKIGNHVAELRRVHPEALHQLDRWRRAHLAKYLVEDPETSESSG